MLKRKQNEIQALIKHKTYFILACAKIYLRECISTCVCVKIRMRQISPFHGMCVWFFFFFNLYHYNKTVAKITRKKMVYRIFFKYFVGPKQNTMADFWLMIWQENIEQVVMLTNIMEGKKVIKYHTFSV